MDGTKFWTKLTLNFLAILIKGQASRRRAKLVLAICLSRIEHVYFRVGSGLAP
jgi:hypothetical protein